MGEPVRNSYKLERVKFTIEADIAETMTGFRAARDFLAHHAHEGRTTQRQCVVTRWRHYQDTTPPVVFAAWGDAKHVRVKQKAARDE